MTSEQINKNFAPDTLLDKKNQEFAIAVMLVEIASQLATFNERFESIVGQVSPSHDGILVSNCSTIE